MCRRTGCAPCWSAHRFFSPRCTTAVREATGKRGGTARVVESPTWVEVKSRLAQMSGTTASFTALHLHGFGALLVGGGNGGHNVVTFAPGDPAQKFLVLTSDVPEALISTELSP